MPITIGTVHKQIRDRAFQILDAAQPPLAGGGVVKGRVRPLPEQFATQVFVYLDFSRPVRAELHGQPDDWTTRLKVECCARDAAGADALDAADEIAGRVYELLAADPSLGGLDLIDLEPIGLAWDTDEAETDLAVTQVLFDVKHRTPATSIAAE